MYTFYVTSAHARRILALRVRVHFCKSVRALLISGTHWPILPTYEYAQNVVPLQRAILGHENARKIELSVVLAAPKNGILITNRRNVRVCRCYRAISACKARYLRTCQQSVRKCRGLQAIHAPKPRRLRTIHSHVRNCRCLRHGTRPKARRLRTNRRGVRHRRCLGCEDRHIPRRLRTSGNGRWGDSRSVPLSPCRQKRLMSVRSKRGMRRSAYHSTAMANAPAPMAPTSAATSLKPLR